jgi:hypothetical protein
MKDRKNIFISHIHDNDHRLPELKRLLAEHGLDVRDASINSLRPNNAQNEEYIKYEILAPRIDWAGVLVVLITADTRNSDYVNWEIEYASRHDTRIVGVWDWGEAGVDVPEALKDCADAIVTWQGETIVDAINGENIFCKADGTPRELAQLPRHNCARP